MPYKYNKRNQTLHLFILVVLLLACSVALGHGDLTLRIAVLTEQLQTRGESADLLLRRGELFRQHGEWQAALDDLARAAQLDPDDSLVQFFTGRVLYQSGQYSKAVENLASYLQSSPGHSASLLYMARSYAALEMPIAASKIYREVQTGTSVRTPDLYFEWAEAHFSNQEERLSGAIAILEEGIKELGPLVSLIQRLVEYDQLAGESSIALQHLELLPSAIKVTPKWLTARADLLRDSQDGTSARHTYRRALDTIEQLPQSRRQSPAMVDLSRYLALQLGE